MAYSYTQHTVTSATASSKTFSVGFDYLRASHITTTVNNVTNTDFNVDTSAGTVTFGSSTTLVEGDSVVLTRSTPKTKSTRVVDFADGSILSEAALDDSALQLLYISQEAFDLGTDTMGADPNDGQWDGNNRRLKNLALPTGDNDAARKIDVDNAVAGSGNLPGVDAGDNDSGLFVNAGDWAIRTPGQVRTHLGLGTSSTVDTGTEEGDIPVFGADGYPAASGELITDILAQGISAAFVEFSYALLSESTDTNWEASGNRIGSGAHTFVNNAPAGGGSAYFTSRADNQGVDIAAGKYMVILPFITYNQATADDGLLKASIGTVDLDTDAGAGTRWDIISPGVLPIARNAGGGAAPQYQTVVGITYVNAATASSIALFAVNAGTAGAGTLIIRGLSGDQVIKGAVLRIGDA